MAVQFRPSATPLGHTFSATPGPPCTEGSGRADPTVHPLGMLIEGRGNHPVSDGRPGSSRQSETGRTRGKPIFHDVETSGVGIRDATPRFRRKITHSKFRRPVTPSWPVALEPRTRISSLSSVQTESGAAGAAAHPARATARLIRKPEDHPSVVQVRPFSRLPGRFLSRPWSLRWCTGDGLLIGRLRAGFLS